MEINPQLELAFKYVQFTGQHIFLTGKAGTGKTTFLHNLKEISTKRMIVVAPTGVAAINAHGVTIHSFFQIPFGPLIGNDRLKSEKQKISREKINIMRSIDLLVIDEISMVRADLLDAVDYVLRRYRNRSKPFGGVQLLMIGDLQQLSPVVKRDEQDLMKDFYETPYFFSAKALSETSFVSIELTHIFRQQDRNFISLLNKVRDNCLDKTSLEILNKRYIPDFQPNDNEGYITLCTHNNDARDINEKKLIDLKGKKYSFKAVVEGIFDEKSYPTDFELFFKVGAQVMFVKNDPEREKLFYNGKIGSITNIKDEIIYVQCPGDENEIAVEPLIWGNIKYSLDEKTNKIIEDVIGKFTQYPLKLAWAITIHKSQGLTFEHAIINAQKSFTHGQVYVALSRCKTFDGLVLSTPINNYSIINDKTVSEFTQQIEENQPDETQLNSARIIYHKELLKDVFYFFHLQNRIKDIEKIIILNNTIILDSTKNFFNSMLLFLEKEIIDVSIRFDVQMTSLLQIEPDVEKNEKLQYRIIDAAKYFSEKLKTIIIDILPKIDTNLDNKEIKKQLTSAICRLDEDTQVKYKTLISCKTGFHIQPLLEAKAVATIQKEKPREIFKFDTIDNKNIDNPVLFNELRLWRTITSAKLLIKPYQIFSQISLYEMVHYLPIDKKSLLQINGIGEKKYIQFGEEILNIIRKYCEENNVVPQENLIQFSNSEKEAKSKKGDSKLLSFKLFQVGKTVAEIATERNLTESTIVSHLANYVQKGEIEIEKLIEKNKLRKILNYFNSTNDKSLLIAKTKLGNNISYEELHLVKAELDRKM
ncbi:MAG: helix-turn-helix domain-containing protein [Bacteroidales bacterium]|jgi:hypothetical protein|nr:helix-turn-helix domain-containing protein [Bacteroidales bacterium]